MAVPDDYETKRMELDIALRNREFELNQFWQRSNYFLALVAALAVGAFASDETAIRLSVSFLAILVSILWFYTNLGSRYWQSFWEQEVEDLSSEMGVRSFMKNGSEIERQMRERTSLGKLPVDKAMFERQMLRKPSVTINMIRLSAIFIIFWIAIFGYTAISTAVAYGSPEAQPATTEPEV